MCSRRLCLDRRRIRRPRDDRIYEIRRRGESRHLLRGMRGDLLWSRQGKEWFLGRKCRVAEREPQAMKLGSQRHDHRSFSVR